MKKLLGISMLALSLMAAGCWTKSSNQPTETNKAETPSAVETKGVAPWLKEVTGMVFVKRGVNLFHAKTQDGLQAGDILETDATGSADIVWPGYGHSLVGPSSTFTVKTSEAMENSLKENLELGSGKVWTRLQKLLGTDSSFEIRSGNVSSVVRGTSFGVEVAFDGVTVKVKESKVGVSADWPETLVIGGEKLQTLMAGSFATSTLSRAELQDPFVVKGDAPLSDADLKATKSNTLTATGEPTAKILAITYRGHLLPVDQLQIEPKDRCDSDHYHAKASGVVMALDGTRVLDPGTCGFGRVKETPSEEIRVW